VDELLATRCFNGTKRSASKIFLFLDCFVVLQVMMKEVGEIALRWKAI
jgi:hypothetical protein